MHLLSLLPTLFLLASASPLTQAQKPTLKKAFEAVVNLGAPIGPVPVAGGQTLIEPIVSGHITGPFFNGKVSSGSAVITATANGTIANPTVSVFGEADDGSAFVAVVTGVGAVGAQVARVTVEVGGKYKALASEFILATLTDNDENPPTKSTIEGWVVSRGD